MFPLVIKNQRHSIKMGNLMPRLTELQNNMTIARQCGNTYEGIYLFFSHLYNYFTGII